MGAWHYVENGRGCGPVETAALVDLITAGKVGPDTLVWQSGMTNWVPVRSVPELATALPKNIPPPIAPPPLVVDEASDISQNKILAALAYLGPFVIVPLLAAPNSKFARYHCNQALVLFLFFFACYCALWIFSLIPFFGCVLIPFHFAAWLAVVFLAVLGVINASSGLAKPLPWIGHYRLVN